MPVSVNKYPAIISVWQTLYRHCKSPTHFFHFILYQAIIIAIIIELIQIINLVPGKAELFIPQGLQLRQLVLVSVWLAQLVKALAALTHVRSSVQEVRV